MGIFDFVKNVGEKLGFGDDDDEATKTAAVKKELESHKLGTDNVDVAVKGDKVILKGVVKDDWHDLVLAEQTGGHVNRISYELCAWHAAREGALQRGVGRRRGALL